MTEPQLTNRQWTEQEVIACALICGYTDAEAKLYFLHYDCQNWKRANGQAITKVQTHMQWCKATGNMPAVRKEKDKPSGTIKKLFTLIGKYCGNPIPVKNRKPGKPFNYSCGMPAVWRGGGDYPRCYCVDCIPPKARAKLSEQGYTRDNGEPL